MIDGFEEETCPLTDYERELVPLFVQSLVTKIGEEKAVTSTTIIKKLTAAGHKITGARVRKIINHIRIQKYVANLVATSKGYYIENDPFKLENYVVNLRARANAILAVVESYKTS